MHSKSKNENNANQNNSFSKTSNNKGSARVNAIKNTNPVNTNYSNNTNKSKTNLVGTVTISVPKNATPINNKKGNTFDNMKKTGSTIIKNDITEDSDLIFNVEIPAIQNDSKISKEETISNLSINWKKDSVPVNLGLNKISNEIIEEEP